MLFENFCFIRLVATTHVNRKNCREREIQTKILRLLQIKYNIEKNNKRVKNML